MEEKAKPSHWKIYVLLILTTSIWGTAFIGGKFAIQDFEPMTVAFFRFFFASLILVPLLLVRREWPKQITLKDWLLFAVLGLTGIYLYNFAFFMASKHAPVIKSSLFIGSNPIVILILSGLFLKEVITKNQVIGLISAVFGVFYIVINGQFETFLNLEFEPIDGILLLAVFSWALYTVVGKVVLKKYSPLVATSFACAIGSAFLFPFTLWETSWSDVTGASGLTWFWLVEMAVLVTVISFIMWYNGVKAVGASKAALFINFMPVSAVLMASIFLGEQLTVYHLIGALFIFGGVYIGTKKKKVKKAAHEMINVRSTVVR
jgi:drug/metabolite transporter (DMT)-like permease